MKAYVLNMLITILLLIFSCKNVKNPNDDLESNELLRIQRSGRINVVTDYNSTSYFIYRGQLMGYQYELLKELADYLGVKLEVIVSNDVNAKFDLLNKGEVDLIAVNLTITKSRRNIVDFTVPHSQTRQVLVQRIPEGKNNIKNSKDNMYLIRNQLELAGKTIYVHRGSSYVQRLNSLSDEIGDTIHIIEVDEGVEKLIEMVSNGDIEYTISDENVAKVNKAYYTNIDVNTPVSFYQNLAWAVKKDSEELLNEINKWLIGFRKTKRYTTIYNKYFENHRNTNIVESEYFAINSGRISEYDEIIKKNSETFNRDWKLIASLIYQESRFNPKAESWAGAFGLMQLMPATANRFGISKTSSPDKQVYAGLRYLQWLENRFEYISDENERLKFVLASYNVGYGHVMDARRLAEKYGKNPNVWENHVEEFILKKTEEKYMNDPVVKHGYCRGTETIDYVNGILERYIHYKNILPD